MFTLPICEDQSVLSMRFPQKLWKIVNECNTGAIQWSKNGKSVLLDYSKFHRDYLDSKLEIFKTTNITSFIRQLNLYGFRKVTGHYREPLASLRSPDVHEFRNENFIRGRFDLLAKVSRKTGVMKHRSTDRKRNVGESSENDPGKSRLVMCQKALTDALNNAALKQGIQEKRKHYTDDSESVLSDVSSSQDSDIICCDVASLEYDNLDWMREPSTSQSNLCATGCGYDALHNYSKSSLQYYQIQSMHESAPSSSDSGQGTMSSLLDPSTSPRRSIAPDPAIAECPYTLEYVMQQMDSSLSEKIYEMLMEENKPETDLPDMPTDLSINSKKKLQDDDLAFKKEEKIESDQSVDNNSSSSSNTSSSSSTTRDSSNDKNNDYDDISLKDGTEVSRIYCDQNYGASTSNSAVTWSYPIRRASYYTNFGPGHYMF